MIKRLFMSTKLYQSNKSSSSPPPHCRDFCQGGSSSVVPEEDRPLQECQRAEFPHKVMFSIRPPRVKAASRFYLGNYFKEFIKSPAKTAFCGFFLWVVKSGRSPRPGKGRMRSANIKNVTWQPSSRSCGALAWNLSFLKLTEQTKPPWF